MTSFGNVRRLPSGRWQARYYGPDGQRRNAPDTFERKTDAVRWLRLLEAQMARGEWLDPERAKITLADYAERWVTERPGLRPRTVALYRWLLRKRIVPHLGGVPIGRLSTALIRQWRAELLASGVSESVTAKAYRLLRSILNTAVNEDKLIPRNPCMVKGADRETPDERPVLSVAQVFQVAAAMPDRFRLMVLLAAFGSLRFGEVIAMRRCDLADDLTTVDIRRAFVEVPGRGLVAGPPKSRAGVRTVTVPKAIRADVLTHLKTYVGKESTALLFTLENSGNAVRRSNFAQRTKWTKTVANLGMAGVHFHDLRHAGNIMASKAGMSTKDLMSRMGHDDMRAALIYQRATQDADERIADSLSKLVDEHRNRDKKAKRKPRQTRGKGKPEGT